MFAGSQTAVSLVELYSRWSAEASDAGLIDLELGVLGALWRNKIVLERYSGALWSQYDLEEQYWSRAHRTASIGVACNPVCRQFVMKLLLFALSVSLLSSPFFIFLCTLSCSSVLDCTFLPSSFYFSVFFLFCFILFPVLSFLFLLLLLSPFVLCPASHHFILVTLLPLLSPFSVLPLTSW